VDRSIVVLPDNDDPGRQHGQRVASSLANVARCIKVVKLPRLPDKGDVSDWLDSGHSVEEPQELVSIAPEWRPPVKVVSKSEAYQFST
jgi:hypothetical protein